MKKIALFLLMLGTLQGANNANQTLALSASAINELAVTGNVTITISESDVGSTNMSKSDSSTSLSVTTNESSKKITAALAADMDYGSLDLSLSNLSSGMGATVTLSSTAQDVYTSLATTAGQSTLTYDFSIPFNNYASLSSQVKQVTFTLTAE